MGPRFDEKIISQGVYQINARGENGTPFTGSLGGLVVQGNETLEMTIAATESWLCSKDRPCGSRGCGPGAHGGYPQPDTSIFCLLFDCGKGLGWQQWPDDGTYRIAGPFVGGILFVPNDDNREDNSGHLTMEWKIRANQGLFRVERGLAR